MKLDKSNTLRKTARDILDCLDLLDSGSRIFIGVSVNVDRGGDRIASHATVEVGIAKEALLKQLSDLSRMMGE